MTEQTCNDAITGGRAGAPTSAHPAPPPRLTFRRGARLPLIQQSEATECGLACLAMVSGYFGHHVSLPELRRKFSLSLKGMTLEQLIEAAHTLGLVCRPLRVDLDELGRLETPCILHWDLDHFVVLRSVKRATLVIHDPAVGERSLSIAEAGQHATGVAVEISKGPNFQQKSAQPSAPLLALAGVIHGLKRALLTIFGLALALEVFGLLAPQLLQLIVDQVLADGDHDLLTFLGFTFLFLMVLQTLFSALRTWTVLWVSSHFNLNWTGNVFQHLLRLPQSYFIKRHLGDIVSRFGAISSIQQTLTTRFVEVVLDGLMTAVTAIVLTLYSPLLTAITVIAVALYGGLRALYFRVYREANLSQIVVQAKQQSNLMEAVRGVQTLRLFNQVPFRSAHFVNSVTDTLNAGIAIQKLNLTFGSVQSLVAGAQRIGVLWLGAWLALKGQFSAGMLMAFAAYADQFTVRASSLIDYAIELRLLRLQGERLADIVLTQPEAFADGPYVGPQPALKIRFDKVSFRYGANDPWVLKDCSFEIEAGEATAIVGASGSGKSTLVRLLLGLLDPLEGSITVGGVDLKHLGKKAYRAMIGSVMQDDHLFAGSIADNISFFDRSANQGDIEHAARLAELHDDIVAMPMGYHSLVGDMGSSLSGGQQQRLTLARALYKQPKLLVLDEATSHLDIECEKRIATSLAAMALTKIVIAHRPETIRSAQRVLVLRDGRITDVLNPSTTTLETYTQSTVT